MESVCQRALSADLLELPSGHGQQGNITGVVPGRVWRKTNGAEEAQSTEVWILPMFLYFSEPTASSEAWYIGVSHQGQTDPGVQHPVGFL